MGFYEDDPIPAIRKDPWLRNADLLPRIDEIRILDDFAVGLEDLVVAVGVAVELFRNLGKRIARLDFLVARSGGGGRRTGYVEPVVAHGLYAFHVAGNQRGLLLGGQALGLALQGDLPLVEHHAEIRDIVAEFFFNLRFDLLGLVCPCCRRRGRARRC